MFEIIFRNCRSLRIIISLKTWLKPFVGEKFLRKKPVGLSLLLPEDKCSFSSNISVDCGCIAPETEIGERPNLFEDFYLSEMRFKYSNIAIFVKSTTTVMSIAFIITKRGQTISSTTILCLVTSIP